MRDSLGPQRPKPEQTQPTIEERSVTKKWWPGNHHAEEARASGLSSQAAENSCDSMPMATLERAMKLANATNAVSSTSALAPSALSSRADNSSVTVGGVCVIASAYSMTSRSSAVKTSDTRQRGTSRALLTSSPSLWAKKYPRSKQKLQPIRLAVAMWANDFRFSSHWFHFCALRPTPKLKFSTFRLCHVTPTGSGTSPNIFRDIRLTRAP